jgi:hypothetical protein
MSEPTRVPLIKEGYATPSHFNNKHLVGKIRQQKPESTVERIKGKLDGVYETAKDVSVGKEKLLLPWQYDKEGKLYSTATDQNNFKIKWLRRRLGLEEEGDFAMNTNEVIPESLVNFDDSNVKKALMDACACTLIELEVDKALQTKEAEFRKGLIHWIIGEGKDSEYQRTWWVNEKGKEPISAATEKDKEKILLERKKLLTANPAISRGIVEQTDFLSLQAKYFLDNLYRHYPQSDEVCLFFFSLSITNFVQKRNFIFGTNISCFKNRLT